MEDAGFREFYQKIVDRYGLAPDAATELLQRILEVLKNVKEDPLQTATKYEILIEHWKREENL